jgi:CRP/FNR family transcriptional regulator
MSETSKVVSIGARRQRCDECTMIAQCLARDFEHPEADGRHDIPVSPRVMHRGEHLFRAGERFDAVFLVRSGAVKTFMISETGEEQVIGFHMPGDLIGFDGIDSGVYECSGAALDTSSVCALPYERLSRLCARSRTVMSRLMRGMSRKTLRDENMLLVLGRKSAEQRMASFLLDQATHRRQQGFCGTEINLSMSRADIGSYLALAVETVSRVLTRLQDGGVITVNRNQIQIRDAQGLAEIAGAGVGPGESGGARRAAG